MTQLACPLCGKNTSLDAYDPSGFDLDIYAVEMVGLGRGRGFRVAGRRSLLNDSESLAPVKERLLDLVELLHDKGVINDDEIEEHLGTSSPQVQKDTDDGGTTDTVEVEDAEDVSQDSELERVAMKVELDIYDAMDLDANEIDENEEIAVRLRSAVRRLISDYMEYREIDE